MRLSKNLIEKITLKILNDLKGAVDIKILKNDQELAEIIKSTIVSDLKIEEEIEKEAEAILNKHISTIAKMGSDKGKVFEAIKTQIARDKNYIIK